MQTSAKNVVNGNSRMNNEVRGILTQPRGSWIDQLTMKKLKYSSHLFMRHELCYLLNLQLHLRLVEVFVLEWFFISIFNL